MVRSRLVGEPVSILVDRDETGFGEVEHEVSPSHLMVRFMQRLTLERSRRVLEPTVAAKNWRADSVESLKPAACIGDLSTNHITPRDHALVPSTRSVFSSRRGSSPSFFDTIAALMPAAPHQ
jgi:hypothetical protein